MSRKKNKHRHTNSRKNLFIYNEANIYTNISTIVKQIKNRIFVKERIPANNIFTQNE